MVAAAKTPDPVDVHVGAPPEAPPAPGRHESRGAGQGDQVTSAGAEYETRCERLSASRLYAACGVLGVKPLLSFDELAAREDR